MPETFIRRLATLTHSSVWLYFQVAILNCTPFEKFSYFTSIFSWTLGGFSLLPFFIRFFSFEYLNFYSSSSSYLYSLKKKEEEKYDISLRLVQKYGWISILYLLHTIYSLVVTANKKKEFWMKVQCWKETPCGYHSE